MVVFGQDGYIFAKVVVFVQNLLYLGKLVVFGHCVGIRAWWLFSGKSCCIRANMVVLAQIWLYSGKSGCIQEKWLYSGKFVVFGQSGCNRAKWLYLDKSGFYRAKVVVFGIKVVVIGQIGCIR